MTLSFPLFPYQIRWMMDTSRLKIYCKSRQIGITFIETLDIVQRCLSQKQKFYYLSVSEDRAAEAIEYAAMHCLAIGALGAKVTTGWVELEQVRFKHCTITFPNGSKIIGLPANARTARGASGNLVLDEFGHHIDAAAIWKAAHAIALWGYHIHVISTPNGQQGEYWSIWTDGGRVDCDAIEEGLRVGHDVVGDRWSRHWTDIHMAKRDGHPVDLDEARDLARTEDTWDQEYCCKFLDESLAWLPYSLLESCTSNLASLHYDTTQPPVGPIYIGMDIGRKQDLSVIWLNERREDRAITRAVVAMEKTPFALQQRQLWDLMPLATRTHIDETGIGAKLAEDTVDRFGELRVAGIPFTGKNAAIIATEMRERLEKKTWLLPNDADVRRDLHAVRRVYTDAGRQSFEAPRTKDGHADRFWAGGLALDAERQALEALKPGDYIGGGSRSRLDPGSFGDDDTFGGYI